MQGTVLLCPCNRKHPADSLKENLLVLLMVSECSARVGVEHHWGRNAWRKLFTLWWARSRREEDSGIV